jgi:hypothetical protein
MSCRVNPTLVKLESKRPQHAFIGLFFGVVKVKEEIENWADVFLRKIIKDGGTENGLSASRESVQPYMSTRTRIPRPEDGVL